MRKIKYFIAGLCLFCLCPLAKGQQAEVGPEDAKQIEFRVVIPEDTPLNENTRKVLKNRLTQAVVLNGSGSSVSPFLLVPVVTVLSKEVTPSAPPMYVTELEVTCYVVDQSRQAILQQSSIVVKGVANNDKKAISQAISSIQSRNGEWKRMITRGKEKIMEYYAAAYEKLLREMEASALSDEEPDVSWVHPQ